MGDRLLAFKKEIWLATLEQKKEQLQTLSCNFSKNQIQLKDSNNKNGALTWLTTLPLKNDQYFLIKQVFWDLIRIRCIWQLSRVPTFGECGVKFSLNHALSSKKEGLISIRQNNSGEIIFWKDYLEVFVRNQKSNHWSEVWRKYSFNSGPISL